MKPILLVIQRNCRNYFLVILLSEFLSVSLNGQEFSVSGNLYYHQIFGKRYTEAIQFITDNTWMKDTLREHNIDPEFALAIVFPELIRYSEIQDKMEISGLLTLYVQYGEKYANFSVGRFQMKPTFAEQLEKDAQKWSVGRDFDLSNTPEARIERVNRLDRVDSQLNYLIVFIKVLDIKYRNMNWKALEDKLKFYATAYNSGYKLRYESIRQQSERKMFYTGIIKGDSIYNYADIAWFYYRNSF